MDPKIWGKISSSKFNNFPFVATKFEARSQHFYGPKNYCNLCA